MDIKSNDESFDAKLNDDDKQPQRYKYYEQSSLSRSLIFYINDTIYEPKYYADMVHLIRTAGPRDVIYIHINTPGGCLSTGIQLINAIHSSQAKTITILEAEASSMGAILFLAGDEFVVHDNCIMMFHHYSGGTFGKGHEQLAQAKATVEWYAQLMKNICIPFLSLDEVDRVLKGEDIWLDSEHIKKRLVKMVEDLNKNANTKTTPKKKASTKKKAS